MGTKLLDRDFFVKQGRKGAKLTNSRLTPEERKESARKAAQARWSKKKAKA